MIGEFAHFTCVSETKAEGAAAAKICDGPPVMEWDCVHSVAYVNDGKEYVPDEFKSNCALRTFNDHWRFKAYTKRIDGWMWDSPEAWKFPTCEWKCEKKR